jgi:outer membrane protein OmpA-like peptidoglycan-associated protein/tetratricopeptide (TPR) repeat protein
MRKYYITALLLSLSAGAFAQEQQTSLQIADKYYHGYNYTAAIPVYEKLAAKKKVSADVLYKLAYSYDQMQNYQKALEKYQAFHDKNPDKNSAVLLRMGDLQKMLGNYSAAKEYYSQYAAKNSATVSVINRMAGCDSAAKWIKERPLYTVSNMALNTNVSDWGPALYGDKIVFTSEDQKEILMAKNSKKVYGWTGNSYLRLYTVDTANASAIADFGAFANDHKSHVGPAAFTSDMSTVYFTATSTSKKDAQEFTVTKKMNVGQRNLQLFFSSKDANGQWMEPKSFNYNDLDQYSVGHAAVSKDGHVLYFASDKPGGYGKTDIWYCLKKEDGKWGNPVNCGPNINTAEDEAFPTVGANNELYFASTGHPGMGGYDIFKSKGIMHYWDPAVNMKSPVNSSYDDFYLSAATDRRGYFSSNRPGGKGSDDIYSYWYDKPRNLVLKAIAMNKETNKPIPGAMIILDVENGARKANARGYSIYQLQPGRNYSVSAMYGNLSPDNQTFNTITLGASDTIEQILYLAPPVVEPVYEVGDVFVLEDLYYDLNKSTIRPDAALVLDRLATTLTKNPTMVIELSSHTDSRASDNYNMTLSQNRARNAVLYLVSRGIDKSRLKAKGYGETKLKNGCSNGVKCSEADHQLNRRTEVKVLSK